MLQGKKTLPRAAMLDRIAQRVAEHMAGGAPMERAWDPVANKPTENSQDQGVLERPLNSAALAGALLAVAKGNQALVRPLFTGNYKFLIA